MVPPADGLPPADGVPPAGPAGGGEPLSAAYEVLRKIGDGGMGTVYLARDRKLGRYVAIKRLNREALQDVSLRRRFFREAETIASLHHRNIVHLFALSEDAEGPYLVMEYVAGPARPGASEEPPPLTLADRVLRDGPLGLGEALLLVIRACRAVEHAHARGVIHRDLKPANILLDSDGEPKIGDFGLAHKGGAEKPLTAPGERFLSLGYGAPEQEQDASRADERADIYGLGGILFFSLSGRNPRFFRESDLPESLRMPVAKALETDPARRWQRVSEMTDALLQVQAPSRVERPGVRSVWRCKWCDAVNPLTAHYCGTCGWSGAEACAECGALTHFGVRFCQECGADRREHERTAALLRRLEDLRNRKDFETLRRQAGDVQGFTPAGPKGRKVAAAVAELGEEARRALVRLGTIRGLIDREVRDENYEEARVLIGELRTLTADALPYENLLQKLPRLAADRDLHRARAAARRGDFDSARRTCQALLDRAPAAAPEGARALLRSVRRRARNRAAARWAVGLLCAALVYVLAAPAVYRHAGGRAEGGAAAWFLRPVVWLRDRSLLRRPLDAYAALWQADGLFAETGAPAKRPAP